MKKIIKKIFEESGFKENNLSTNKISFYEKKDKEYFLISNYSEQDVTDFFSSDKTNGIISLFDNLKKQRTDIEKNTSLLILFKVNSFSEVEKFKNQIFRIEEDEYFFRKYIICYTNESIIDLKVEPQLSRVMLNEKLGDDNSFKKFEKNKYFSDEYFLIMQLFVKLPFLKLEIQPNDFTNIKEIISKDEDKLIKNIIVDDQLGKLDEIITMVNEDSDEFINSFLKKFEL